MKSILCTGLLALTLASGCVVSTYAVEPVAEPAVYWYWGYHLMPGGGYCYMEGRHWHDFAPEPVVMANYYYDPGLHYYVFEAGNGYWIPPAPMGYHGIVTASGERVMVPPARGGFQPPNGYHGVVPAARAPAGHPGFTMYNPPVANGGVAGMHQTATSGEIRNNSPQGVVRPRAPQPANGPAARVATPAATAHPVAPSVVNAAKKSKH